MNTNTTYTTRTEAIEREIIEPLGEYANGYMINAIADEVLEWVDGRGANPDHPTAIWLPAQGFRLAVDTDEFWEVVQRHAVDGEEPDGYDEAEAASVTVGALVELSCTHPAGTFEVMEVCVSCARLVLFNEDHGRLVVSPLDVTRVL